LDQPYAIVTGGAVDEGLSCAESLLEAGIPVSIWDEDPDQLAIAKEELAGHGEMVDMRRVDVGDIDSVRSSYADLSSEWGVPYSIFTMAVLRNTFMLGMVSEFQPKEPTPFWALDMHRAARVVQVNSVGSLNCAAAVAPDMVKVGRGNIVLFSTGLGTQRSSNIPYGPSRAFVEAFAGGAFHQLEPHGVRMNVLASGGRVNRRDQLDPDNEPHDWMKQVAPFLASEASVALTGKVFRGAGLEPVER
jgi:3-oxoacyl-[acyl-carrier protein] reductase